MHLIEFHTKQAFTSPYKKEAKEILDRIYQENPAHWPYGLDMECFDGGCYMIREASTKKAVGFTGWQNRVMGDKTVGYYSIGILPEFRKKSWAKEAVFKTIAHKLNECDEVRALIKADNIPSIRLAESLGVGIDKKANFDWKDVAIPAGAGLALAGGLDQLAYGDGFKGFAGNKSRIGNAIFNGLLGAGGAGIDGFKGFTHAVEGAAIKDLAIKAMSPMHKVDSLLDSIQKSYDNDNGGNISVTLPNKGDNGVKFDMPSALLSNHLQNRLRIDATKKIREDAKQRSTPGLRKMSRLLEALY
jgi:RimJ/RimL family protein N-acetyltransferase